MKKLYYISVLALLTMVSCTSRLYTGAEFDDLYYLPSDKPVEKVKPSINEQIADGSVKQQDYYDNIYASDTLVADDYADAVDINSSVVNNNNNSGGYDYYDNFSYTGRLRNFYGNYFDPYWRDPFYSGWGYPSYGYGFGYGGSPYSYGYANPYTWDSYYSYGMYGGYGGFYPGYYGGGYYGGYYGGGLFGGYGYYPYYSYGGGSYYNEGRNSVAYGRRERPSNLSSNWNNSMSPQGNARRDGALSSNSGINRRASTGTSGNQSVASDQRRTNPSNITSRQVVNPSDRRYSQNAASRSTNVRTATSSQRNAPDMKPAYNSTSRSYTPSYNNPRMSTRPSYNNSRVSESVSSGSNRNSNVINNSRTNTNSGTRSRSDQGSYQNSYNNSRSNPSSGGGNFQRRSASPSGNSAPAVQYRESTPRSSGSYSVPTRSSVDRSSSYSSGSNSGSSSSGRSSYSSGSSGSSYSSGSSSGGSSSSSGSSSGGSSSSSSSGGSRR
jgi:hypothetical protein